MIVFMVEKRGAGEGLRAGEVAGEFGSGTLAGDVLLFAALLSLAVMN